MDIAPYCLCTVVSTKALQALLEASGRGSFRDDHPWLVARDLLSAYSADERRLPILFAAGEPAAFSHWGFVDRLEVLELHRSSWATTLAFTALHPVNPIFEDIDSLFLKPTPEQLERERREGIHQHRYPLTLAELRPYAICETPAFIVREE
ncbi:MAG: hypothetical protein RIE06_28145 [Roseibium album]|uniref:hypothetical protein n=1 Tax=Roseibium album TaxID=311410 RepID=UPI0032EFECEE